MKNDPIKEAYRILKTASDFDNQAKTVATILVGLFQNFRKFNSEDEAIRLTCKLFVAYINTYDK